MYQLRTNRTLHSLLSRRVHHRIGGELPPPGSATYKSYAPSPPQAPGKGRQQDKLTAQRVRQRKMPSPDDTAADLLSQAAIPLAAVGTAPIDGR